MHTPWSVVGETTLAYLLPTTAVAYFLISERVLGMWSPLVSSVGVAALKYTTKYSSLLANGAIISACLYIESEARAASVSVLIGGFAAAFFGEYLNQYFTKPPLTGIKEIKGNPSMESTSSPRKKDGMPKVSRKLYH